MGPKGLLTLYEAPIKARLDLPSRAELVATR